MKKIKLLSFTLICTIIFQIIMPILTDIDWNVVFAEDSENRWDISKNGDGSVIAELSDDGTLTISGSGEMKYWNEWSSKEDWHASGKKEKVKNVIINKGVTNIGSCSFYECSNLTTITIPEGVISIGYDTFSNCKNLTSITIPESIEDIKGGAFSSCSSLTNIEVSNNNKKYTSNEGVLYTKDNTKIITYPAGKKDTEYTILKGVTNIEAHAFDGCSSLTSITIPEGVTSIKDYAFYGCSNLANIIIPKGVTGIESYAFSACSSLTNITIPEGVTSIEEGAFFECSSLVDITIPETVTSIGDFAFSRCSSLTSITIPEKVIKIETRVFDECSSLTSITIPEGVTSIEEGAFFECSSLVDITIPETVTSIGSCTFKGCSSLTSITIPKGVTSIGSSTFQVCSSLTSIAIPETVISIGSFAFAACSSLKSITIPETVTSIGSYAFAGCSGLTSITIPKGVTSIENHVFSGCSNLVEVNISEGVNKIESDAFSECTSLENIYIPDTVSLISSGAFSYCLKLKSISIPENVDCADRILDDSVLQIWATIEDGMTQEIPLPDIIRRAKNEGDKLYAKSEFTLLNCEINKDNNKLIINTKALKDGSEIGIKVNEGPLEGLTVRVMIPEVIWDISKDENSNVKAKLDYNKKLLNITGNGKMKDFGWDFGPWYYLKDYIEDVTIEEGVTNIGTYSFYDNSEIKNINLSKTIKCIDPYAFRGCDSLKVINIPEGTQSIGTGAFSACNNLNEVNISSTVFAIGLDNVEIEWNEGMLEGLKVTSTGEVFKDCINLKNINVNSNNKYYSSDGGILYNKSRSNLVIYPAGKEEEKFEIPNTVLEIGRDAFDSCSNLKSIEIPGTVEKIENQSFRGSNLSCIILNEGLKSIGEYAFFENNNIEEIYIPSSVESIGHGALCNTEKLRKIEVSQDNKIYTSENGVLLSKDKSKIIQYPANKDWSMYIIPDTVKSIESGAFAYGNNLKYLRINDNTNKIGTSAFVDSNLMGIYIPNSVEDIEVFNVAGDITPFYGCSNCTIYCNDNSYAKEYSVKYSLNYSTNTQEIFDKFASKAIKSISVTTLPTRINYVVGQDFDKTGMIVTASYNDGSSKEVTDYEVVDGNNLAEGKTSVTINYTENGITKTTTQNITVVENELKEISITKVPDNISYIEGQDFDKTGMIVTASYNDGSSKEVTDYEVVDGNNLTAGKASVTISYTENGITKTIKQNITVSDKIQIKIEEYVEDKKENISYIKNISPNTTIKEVIEKIKTNGEIKIYKESQEIIDKNSEIATGMKIKILLNNEQVEYEAIVRGDINGDGKISLVDLANLKLSMVGKRTLNAANTISGDINGDGKTSLNDLVKLKMYLVGKIII